MFNNLKTALVLTIATIGICLSTTAYARLWHTNLIPDTLVNNNGVFLLDLDDNGQNDLAFTHADFTLPNGITGNEIRVDLLHLDVQVMGGYQPMDSTQLYPFAYCFQVPISNSAHGDQWISKDTLSNEAYILNYRLSDGSSLGTWTNDKQGFMGVRFQVGGHWYYAWVWMKVGADASYCLIKSYCWKETTSSYVLTGFGSGQAADKATQVGVADISDFQNASDIQVSFNKATDETEIAEYRVFIVPTGPCVPPFTVKYYSIVIPNGQNHILTLPSNQLDVYGDTIVENKEYYPVVYSAPDTCLVYSGGERRGPKFILTSQSLSINEPSQDCSIYLEGDNIHVQSANAILKNLLVMDMNGKVLYNEKTRGNSATISTFLLPKGLYLIQIETEAGLLSKKLVL